MTKVDLDSRNTIRAASERMDAERYRITRTGEVHFYGRMPNSIVTGWWLYASSVIDAVAFATGRDIRPERIER